jgi:hypothetical protein
MSASSALEKSSVILSIKFLNNNIPRAFLAIIWAITVPTPKS